MAHVAKYTAAAVTRMTDHYGRTQGDGVHRSNESINPERTSLNYNLAPDRPGGQLAYLQQRLSEVKVQKRADVKVLCDWIVTLPRWQPKPGQDVDPDQIQRRFFEATYRFLSERYGEQNVISAYVHMDETTPHMHFAFVPVVRDKKHPEREKVSAKERINRSELQTFHGDLERYIQEAIPQVSFEVLNDATRDGNRTVTELKREAEIRKQAEYAAATEQARQQAQDAQEQAEEMERRTETLQGEIGQLEQQQAEYAAATEQARQQAQDAQENVDDLERRTGDLQGEIGQLEQRQAEYAAAAEQARQKAQNAQEQAKEMERRTVALRGSVKTLQQQKVLLSRDQIGQIDVKPIPLSKRVSIDPRDLKKLQDTAVMSQANAIQWRHKADEAREQIDDLRYQLQTSRQIIADRARTQSQMEQELTKLRPWAAIGRRIIDTVRSLGDVVVDLLQRSFPSVNWSELLSPPAELSRDSRKPQQRGHKWSQDLDSR